jgi:hypothetical protein
MSLTPAAFERLPFVKHLIKSNNKLKCLKFTDKIVAAVLLRK